jgi:hypothetical protein
MAHPARVAIAAAQNADHPSFSPGGTRLFYSNCPCLQGESDDSTLYYVNLAGGPARTIALDAGYASYEFGGIVSTGTPSPVLGNRLFVGDNGKGWGTQQPSVVYNGGDPGGLVLNLHWTGWGSATAYGTGKGYVPKPNGGWNPHPVVEQFRASGLAMCHGKLTYTRLYVRNASRPGAAVSAGWSSWVGANGDICQPLQQYSRATSRGRATRPVASSAAKWSDRVGRRLRSSCGRPGRKPHGLRSLSRLRRGRSGSEDAAERSGEALLATSRGHATRRGAGARRRASCRTRARGRPTSHPAVRRRPSTRGRPSAT